MNFRIAGHDWAVRWRARLAPKVGDDPAGFADEHQSGRRVPRREHQLPESIEASACNIGKIERG